jgi:hypothetical protein
VSASTITAVVAAFVVVALVAAAVYLARSKPPKAGVDKSG